MALPVITIAQMREWEKATWASGQTEAEVIRRVGKAVGRYALSLTRKADAVLILAGKGNNGADAKAAADSLVERRVNILEIKNPAEDFSRLETLLSLKPALVIDGLFGIGLNRPLSPEWVQLIQRINHSRAQVLAVDVPSGLNGDTGEAEGAAIEAAVTMTVGAPKTGMLKSNACRYVGRLEVAANVGLVDCPAKSELNWTLPEDFADYPPRRAAATHKGTYGHVGILAGSLGYHGAAVLASRGAQRAQPGLITLHTMEEVYHSIAAQLQAVMVSIWKPDKKLPGNYSSILLGPGLAAEEIGDQIKLLTRLLWRDSTLPLVVDASALDWVPLDPVPRNAIRVLTPHPGEAARLLRTTSAQIQSNRFAAVRNISQRFGDAWVVLKGHQTVIGRSCGDLFVNSSGNAHLAQGGSGDLLGGFITGLLAQPALQADVLRTLRYAVWQHGAAADLLQSTRPNWTVEELSAVLGGVQPLAPLIIEAASMQPEIARRQENSLTHAAAPA